MTALPRNPDFSRSARDCDDLSLQVARGDSGATVTRGNRRRSVRTAGTYLALTASVITTKNITGFRRHTLPPRGRLRLGHIACPAVLRGWVRNLSRPALRPPRWDSGPDPAGFHSQILPSRARSSATWASEQPRRSTGTWPPGSALKSTLASARLTGAGKRPPPPQRRPLGRGTAWSDGAIVHHGGGIVGAAAGAATDGIRIALGHDDRPPRSFTSESPVTSMMWGAGQLST